MGTLFWQLNDNWPVASWASIEYGGKWKQLQYHARRFYQPVIAVVYKDQEEITRLHAVSDLRCRSKISVKAEILDFDGKLLKSFELESSLKPGESKCLKTFKPAELAGLDPNGCFMELTSQAETADGELLTHENSCFFSVYKHCDLRHAEVKTAVRPAGENRFEVTLTTDRPAFFVTLDTPGIRGIFSDNSFTLVPGRTKVLTFSAKAKTTAAALEKALTLNYLRKTYN